MFYSEYVLAKRGPLGNIWLAAHWTDKLSKTQIDKSDVVEACKNIIEPEVKLALRTSGHLLLGVVRIHDRKQRALVKDCGDAFTRITLAFRPISVDLPQTSLQAPAHAITLQETFADFTEDLPEIADDLLMQEDFDQQGFAAFEETDLTTNYHEFSDRQPGPTLDDEFDRDGDVFRPDMDQSAGLEIEQGRAADDSELQGGDVRAPSPYREMGGDDFFDVSNNQLDDSALQTSNIALPKLDLKPRSASEAATPRGEKRRKRAKLLVDDRTDIPSRTMKAWLVPEGTNDICRRPHREDFLEEVIDYDKPAVATGSVKRPLEDDGLTIELMFSSEQLGKTWCYSIGSMMRKRLKWRSGPVVEQGRDADFTFDDGGRAPSPEAMPAPGGDGPDFSFGPDHSGLDVSAAPAEEPSTAEQPPAVEESTLFGSAEDDSTVVTSTQYEEAGWSRRTKKMLTSLKNKFEETPVLSFDDLTRNQRRNVAAAALFEVLVLKTRDYIDIEQKAPFDDILIRPTDKIDA